MICLVYRSEKKQGAYVYLAHKKSLSDLPQELLQLLGDCVQVMQLNLSERDKLASEDIAKVRDNLETKGYHLQMPPKVTTGVVNYGA